jgi:hypothetical protein
VLVAAGIGVAGQALGAYLLSTEMVGASWRGVAGIITQVRMPNLALNAANDCQSKRFSVSFLVSFKQVTCIMQAFGPKALRQPDSKLHLQFEESKKSHLPATTL